MSSPYSGSRTSKLSNNIAGKNDTSAKGFPLGSPGASHERDEEPTPAWMRYMPTNSIIPKVRIKPNGSLILDGDVVACERKKRSSCNAFGPTSKHALEVETYVRDRKRKICSQVRKELPLPSERAPDVVSAPGSVVSSSISSSSPSSMKKAAPAQNFHPMSVFGAIEGGAVPVEEEDSGMGGQNVKRARSMRRTNHSANIAEAAALFSMVCVKQAHT